MTPRLAVGDEAPDFDLASTENAVIMLRDEVPRAAAVLYFFADPADERARRDLAALAAAQPALAELPVSVLGVSPAKVDALRALQAELGLLFPLLSDDRGFARSYGIEPPGEDGDPPPPALVAVDRRQKVVWLANPVASVAESLPEVEKNLGRLPRPTENYPRKALNWVVDRWVNQRTGLRKRRG